MDLRCHLLTFSFRDWYDKKAGLSESLRVLKTGAPIIIIDPAKINRLHGILGALWMRVWVGSTPELFVVCGITLEVAY